MVETSAALPLADTFRGAVVYCSCFAVQIIVGLKCGLDGVAFFHRLALYGQYRFCFRLFDGLSSFEKRVEVSPGVGGLLI